MDGEKSGKGRFWRFLGRGGKAAKAETPAELPDSLREKRIALIANDTSYTYNLRDQLMELLIREGYALYLISEKRNYVEELERMGVECVHVDTSRHDKSLLANGRLLAAYLRLLWKMRPALALCYNIKPDVYGGLACRLLGIPYISTVTGLGTALEQSGSLQFLASALYRIGLRGARRVVFQNPENRDFFLGRRLLPQGGASAALVPGSGVNLAKYPALPYPEGEEVHFLFIARILREKGIVLYLHLAKYLHGLYPAARFHILGLCDDPRYLQLIERYTRKGYVLYHGEQADLHPFYAMAGCIVHPSWYPEGISNVLLEAAACARPVISTDRSGCREMVEDGKTGYIVPPKNQAALNEAALRFLSLSLAERREMGIRGREKIEKEFDRAQVAEQYLSMIRSIL